MLSVKSNSVEGTKRNLTSIATILADIEARAVRRDLLHRVDQDPATRWPLFYLVGLLASRVVGGGAP